MGVAVNQEWDVDRAIRVAGWIGYLALAWWLGGVAAWIVDWQQPLVIGAGAAFIIIAIIGLWPERTGDAPPAEDADDALLQSLIHLLPLFLLIGGGVTTLGQRALERSDLFAAPAMPPGPLTAATTTLPAATITAAASLSASAAAREEPIGDARDLSLGWIAHPLIAVGGEVTAIGMVFTPTQAQRDSLPERPDAATVPHLLYRFEIVCCAADALPKAVILRGLPTDPPWPNDTWIRVRARVERAADNSGNLTVLNASAFERIAAPASPFIPRKGP
jgi:hypothetical protein